MRLATIVVLAAVLLVSAGCGGRVVCEQVSSQCTVTCAALPGQVFTGSVTASGETGTDKGSLPVSGINGMCRRGDARPTEAQPCYDATPWQEREASIDCDCQPWVVTNGDVPCAGPVLK